MDSRYRFSRFTAIVELSDMVVLSNGVEMTRQSFSGKMASTLKCLNRSHMTREEIVTSAGGAAHIAPIFDSLVAKRLIVPDCFSEEQYFRERLAVIDTNSNYVGRMPSYWSPSPIKGEDVPLGPLSDLHLLLIGGCVLQFAIDAIQHEGLRRGYNVSV